MSRPLPRGSSAYQADPVRRAMRPLMVLFGSVLLGAAAEVAVLILIGRQIGAGLTLLLVLATTVLGAWVLRREGPRSWRAFRADVQQRKPPGPSATDGLLVLVGGLLMVFPGFLSDIVGVLLVAPPTRRLFSFGVQSWLARRLTPAAATTLFGPRTVRARTGTPRPTPPPATSTPPGDEPPIEGEIVDR